MLTHDVIILPHKQHQFVTNGSWCSQAKLRAAQLHTAHSKGSHHSSGTAPRLNRLPCVEDAEGFQFTQNNRKLFSSRTTTHSAASRPAGATWDPTCPSRPPRHPSPAAAEPEDRPVPSFSQPKSRTAMGSPDPQQPQGFPRAARAPKSRCRPPRPHGCSAFAYSFALPALTALAGHNVHLLAPSKGISGPTSPGKHSERQDRPPRPRVTAPGLQGAGLRLLSQGAKGPGAGEKGYPGHPGPGHTPLRGPVAGCLRSRCNGWLGKGLASPPPPRGPRSTTARRPGRAGPSLPQVQGSAGPWAPAARCGAGE